MLQLHYLHQYVFILCKRVWLYGERNPVVQLRGDLPASFWQPKRISCRYRDNGEMCELCHLGLSESHVLHSSSNVNLAENIYKQ